MLLTTLLTISALTNSYADTINCNTQNSCDLQTIECITNEPCNIFCLDQNSCSHSTINCKEGYECNILCNNTQSCLSININCPSDHQCSINCRADSSCKYSVINCPANNECDIICDSYCDENWGCSEAQFSCSHSQIICPMNSRCNIVCGYYGCTKNVIDGGLNSPLNLDCHGHAACRSSDITCPQNADCFIDCNDGINACSASGGETNIPNGPYKTTVLCPMNNNCYVHCGGYLGCYDLEINAKESSGLAVTGCISGYNCQDIQIFCPPRSQDKKNCFIEGTNDLFGSDPSTTNGVTMRFYAYNGWNDIDFSGYSGTIYGGNFALLYCTVDYSESCVISSTSWSCIDRNSICMHPPTIPPTQHPTLHPTQKTTPPTNTPSSKPTILPSAIPTIPPTQHPTMHPTQKTTPPTNTPSFRPTILPSAIPTMPPSNLPTYLQNTTNILHGNTLRNFVQTMTTQTPYTDITTLLLIIALIVCFCVIMGLVGCVIYIYCNKKSNVKSYNHVPPISEHGIEMTSELKIWIEKEVGLPEYYELFIEHGFDRLFLVKLITPNQLNEIGINKIGHKMRILQKIAKLKNNTENEEAGNMIVETNNDTDDVRKAFI